MEKIIPIVAFCAAFFLSYAAGQDNTYYNNREIQSDQKPRIALQIDMPITELVDTCHSYAEQKAVPLRQRIQQLEEENRALRNGQTYTPNYMRDLPSNTGANQNTGAHQNYINYGNSGAKQNQINACQSSPCRNRGTCQPFVNGVGYKCQCAINYRGVNCENRISTNGGSFNSGFTGAGDSTKINEPNTIEPNFNTYSYPKSCREIYDKHQKNSAGTQLPDSVYSIRPEPSKPVISVFCNMTAKGWTLVYAYKFTKGGPTMSDFTSQQNAVTPIPNWPLKVSSERSVPYSTKPPRNETDYNAVDFSLWKHIGKDFLIKSNFVNWFKCVPNGGSFVDMKKGNVTCTMTEKLYHSKFNGCFSSPTWFEPLKYSYGPRLGTAKGTYFYWDSSERFNFPIHNPCNSFTIPENLDFSNPRGAVYLY